MTKEDIKRGNPDPEEEREVTPIHDPLTGVTIVVEKDDGKERVLGRAFGDD